MRRRNMGSSLNHAFAARLLLRMSVMATLSLAALGSFGSNAVAHDPSGMSARDVALEQALAEAQDQRDQIVRSPAASQQTKDEAESVMASLFKWSRLELTVCFWPNPDPHAAMAETAEQTEIATLASKWTTNAAISFQFYNGDKLNTCNDHAS